jgi:hypothetical protein
MGWSRTRTRLTAGALSAGLLAGSASAAPTGASAAPAAAKSCPALLSTQAFAAFGDESSYDLTPDGDFASGLSGWSVSGSAGLVAETVLESGPNAAKSQSLDLPAGSSATSPATCLNVNDPTIRFFAVNHGNPASQLRVSVVVTPSGGVPVSVPLAAVSSNGTWAPSPVIFLGVNLLAAATSATVQFTFTPIGAGNWGIDDLYVDPWGRT